METKTIAVVAIALVLVGAIVFTVADAEAEADVEIGMVNWACATASSNVLALVLEEEGYNVDLVDTEAGVMYTGLAQGDTHVTTTAWMPYTHGSYWDVYGDRLTEVNKNIPGGAKLGLVVPSYTAEMLNSNGNASIADLKANEDEFDKKITGIDAGAGIMDAAGKAIDDYNLDGWELVESSDAGMVQSLETAVAKEEHIVVTLWDPHWVFAAVDGLVYLEDPEESMGGDEYIATMVNTEWANDAANEDIVAIITAFEWTMDDINEVMLYQDEHGVVEGAQLWINENREKVDAWLGN